LNDILFHPVTLFLSGIVFGAVALFALLEFFKTESEWRRGARLWVLIVFLGFILVAFVLAAGRISGGFS
jgi:multisubunit Na+/H+ antiporter MnhE subunit